MPEAVTKFTDQRLVVNEKKRLADKMRAWRAKNPYRSKEIARCSYARHLEKRRQDDRKRYPFRKEKQIIRQAAAYRLNKEIIKAKAAVYYAEHREARKAKQREYNELNHHRQKEYRVANRVVIKARYQSWVSKNRDKVRFYANKRRALQLGCQQRATPKEIASLLSTAIRCCYCKKKFSSTVKKTVEHMIPLSRGGSDSMDNLGAACFSCNRKKNRKTPLEYARSIGYLFL